MKLHLTHNPCGVRWLTVGLARILIWDTSLQPSEEIMGQAVAAFAGLDGDTHPVNTVRTKEWLASRMLSVGVTGHVPRKSIGGNPQWPDDWTGSITHKSGHVAMWLSRRPSCNYGIDLEASADFSIGLLQRIMSGPEILMSMAAEIRYRGSIVFSAKEAIFKLLYVDVGAMFYFDAAELSHFQDLGDECILDFRITRSLSAKINRGTMVRVWSKSVILDGRKFWLSAASRSQWL